MHPLIWFFPFFGQHRGCRVCSGGGDAAKSHSRDGGAAIRTPPCNWVGMVVVGFLGAGRDGPPEGGLSDLVVRGRCFGGRARVGTCNEFLVGSVRAGGGRCTGPWVSLPPLGGGFPWGGLFGELWFGFCTGVLLVLYAPTSVAGNSLGLRLRDGSMALRERD